MLHAVTGNSLRERDLWHALRRDMDRALDSDTGPKGTVLCWCRSSLAQELYVIGYVCVERVRRRCGFVSVLGIGVLAVKMV